MKYDTIRRDLEAKIAAGAWPPGTRIPTEAELGASYGVSRITAQRAVQELVRQGLVVRYRRKGTFVVRTESERDLLGLADPRNSGPEIDGRHIVNEARVLPADRAAARLPEPGPRPEAPLIQLRRTKLNAAERPIATELAVIPFALAPDLLDEPLEDLTTVAYFQRIGVPVRRSRLSIAPHALSAGEAAALQSAPGTAVFALRRHLWLADGTAAETFESVLVPDHPFFIEQTIPEPPSPTV